jgi:hypothetical protein
LLAFLSDGIFGCYKSYPLKENLVLEIQEDWETAEEFLGVTPSPSPFSISNLLEVKLKSRTRNTNYTYI